MLAAVLAPAAAATAHSLAFRHAEALWFRTTPDNADYQAKVCARLGLPTCGDYITRGDGEQFAADCLNSGRDAGDVALALRYWADRSRARGVAWRVYTRTERGGYPYTCRFALVAVR